MKVTFRVLEGDTIALFPYWTYNQGKRMCMSYMHIGQHSGASIDLIYELPKASPEQCSVLWRELVSLGYDELELFMCEQSNIPKLEPSTAEINKRDGLCFESTAILFDDWELLVSTYKRGSGEVVTTASASQVKHENGYTSRTHALFQDYMETVSRAKYKRVTAKVLAQHHDDSMKLWELCVQRAYEHTKKVLATKAG